MVGESCNKSHNGGKATFIRLVSFTMTGGASGRLTGAGRSSLELITQLNRQIGSIRFSSGASCRSSTCYVSEMNASGKPGVYGFSGSGGDFLALGGFFHDVFPRNPNGYIAGGGRSPFRHGGMGRPVHVRRPNPKPPLRPFPSSTDVSVVLLQGFDTGFARLEGLDTPCCG